MTPLGGLFLVRWLDSRNNCMHATLMQKRGWAWRMSLRTIGTAAVDGLACKAILAKDLWRTANSHKWWCAIISIKRSPWLVCRPPEIYFPRTFQGPWSLTVRNWATWLAALQLNTFHHNPPEYQMGITAGYHIGINHKPVKKILDRVIIFTQRYQQ